MRDELGVNDDDSGAMFGQSERARKRHQKSQLSMGLNALPEPQYQYEIEVPEVKGDGGSKTSTLEEDAADVDARERAAKQAALEAELARRSAAVRRGLPRPNAVDPSLAKAQADDSEQGIADGLVQAEMCRLLTHDAAKYPYRHAGQKGKKKEKKRKRTGDLEKFEDEELAQARALIASELKLVVADKGGDVDPSAFAKSWEETFPTVAYLPARSSYGILATASANERLASLQHEYETLRDHASRHHERAKKIEEKLRVKTKGYEARSKALLDGISSSYETLDRKNMDLMCFNALAETEAKALPQRVNDQYGLLKKEQARNAELQVEYTSLVKERDDLWALCMMPQTDPAAAE